MFRDGDDLFLGFVVRSAGELVGYVDRCPHTGLPLALAARPLPDPRERPHPLRLARRAVPHRQRRLRGGAMRRARALAMAGAGGGRGGRGGVAEPFPPWGKRPEREAEGRWGESRTSPIVARLRRRDVSPASGGKLQGATSAPNAADFLDQARWPPASPVRRPSRASRGRGRSPCGRRGGGRGSRDDSRIGPEGAICGA